MSIRINDKCVGCGRCVEVCPGSLIDLVNRRAVMKYPRDCWGCASCLKECRVGAIEFFLGEDMGGGDTYMQVDEQGRLLNWKFYNSSGEVRTITVDSTSSNKY